MDFTSLKSYLAAVTVTFDLQYMEVSSLQSYPCITVCALVLLSSFVSNGPKGKSEQDTGEVGTDMQTL